MAQPTLLTQPFGAQGDKNSIPNTTTDRGKFSQALAFPEATGLPIAQGGVPPTREDFNGAFFMLSALLFYAQTGGQWQYESTQKYHKPAIVYDTDGNLYFCTDTSTEGTSVKPSTDTAREHWTPLNVFLNGAAVVAFKGSVATYSDLPTTGLTAGDVYNVIATNKNYSWNGTSWVEYGTTTDLSAYLTITSAQATYLTIAAAANKANIDGYYEQLTSGFAENLVGRDDGTIQTLTYRTTGGTADVGGNIANIDSIHGNTIKWNQKVLITPDTYRYRPMWDSLNSYFSPYHATLVASASGNLMTATASKNYMSLYINVSQPSLTGHKIYMSANVTTTGNLKANFACISIGSSWNVITNNIKTRISTVITPLDTLGTTAISFSPQTTGTVFDGTETANIQDFMLIDLTQMFGAGNEPSTAAEFEALFPLDYYAYNAGELVNLTATGIKTVGFNAYNHTAGTAALLGGHQYQITGTYTSLSYSTGETITPDASGLFTPTKDGTLTVTGGTSTDTCIHLTWSGYRNGEYEPYWTQTRDLPIATVASGVFADGMKSAGTVYDELTKDKAIKRIGKVDLGTLTWSEDTSTTASTGKVFKTSALPTGCKAGTASAVSNLICAKYNADTLNNVLAGTTNDTVAAGTNTIEVYTQTNYTDAAAFKTAMSGVYLYYELATPVETSISPALNLSYKVDDFGTEQELPVNDDEPETSPLKAVITYGMNAVDTLRNLPKNFISKISFDQLATTLNSVYGITITPTYDTATQKYTFTASGGLVPVASKPASRTATGTKGNYFFSAEEQYLYLCIDTNTWRRIELLSW